MTKTAIHLRPATPADVSTILTLIRELATYEAILDELHATEDGLRRHLFGPKPAAEVILAIDGDQAVGFALFCSSFSTLVGKPTLYLDDIYVRPSHRKLGLGKRLLGYLAQLALERDYGRMDWYVVRWNEPAIGFYQSLQAKEMTDWAMFQIKGEPLERLAELAEDR